MDLKADVLFTNGSVITVDSENRICEAVAVAGNRTLYVGTRREAESLIGGRTKVVNLEGRSLLPGFIDAHCHPGLHAVVKSEIQCGGDKIRSIEDIKTEIKRRARTTPPGEWIKGWGYNHTLLKEKRHPNRHDLDEAAPDHRVFISRTCGHVVVVNTRVLLEFGIGRGTPDPPGGKIERDDHSEPTGVLFEQAQIPIRERIKPSYAEREMGLPAMNRDFLSRGITSAHDASGWHSDELRSYQQGRAEENLNVRIYFMVRSDSQGSEIGDHFLESGLMTGFGDNKIRLGAYKLMMDGSGTGQSAAMNEPYPTDPENCGILWMDQESLDREVLKGHKAGYQVAVHAIGDRAIEMSLLAFEKALKAQPRRDHRHRIEHCGFLDSHMMGKMRQLGLTAALGQPFLYEMGDNYMDIFGPERLEYLYPLRSLMERGIPAALSSDTPVMDPNPLHGIYFAVAHKSKSGRTIASHEAVSVLEAIRAYTIIGAYLSFEEHIKGSLESGKLADLVVLSQDILKTPPEEILNIQVVMTMVDGRVVYGLL